MVGALLDCKQLVGIRFALALRSVHQPDPFVFELEHQFPERLFFSPVVVTFDPCPNKSRYRLRGGYFRFKTNYLKPRF